MKWDDIHWMWSVLHRIEKDEELNKDELMKVIRLLLQDFYDRTRI